MPKIEALSQFELSQYLLVSTEKDIELLRNYFESRQMTAEFFVASVFDIRTQQIEILGILANGGRPNQGTLEKLLEPDEEDSE